MGKIKWVRIDRETGEKEYITLEEMKKGLKESYKDIEQAVHSLITKQVSSLRTPFFNYEIED